MNRKSCLNNRSYSNKLFYDKNGKTLLINYNIIIPFEFIKMYYLSLLFILDDYLKNGELQF